MQMLCTYFWPTRPINIKQNGSTSNQCLITLDCLQYSLLLQTEDVTDSRPYLVMFCDKVFSEIFYTV